MDRFQELTSFIAVVEAGSFVAAADATGPSKAAVSRDVADFEKRLGARLLYRTTRRLSLTDDGQAFFARSKEVLAATEEAEAEISSRSGEATGLLRINAPLSFGVLHLAPPRGRFARESPKMSLDIWLSDPKLDLVDEGFDLAVRITNPPISQLVSPKLDRSEDPCLPTKRILRRPPPSDTRRSSPPLQRSMLFNRVPRQRRLGPCVARTGPEAAH